MTPTLSNWMDWHSTANLEDWQQQYARAGGVNFIIDKNAVSIVLDRNGVQQSAQTVMITGVAAASEQGSESGTTATAQLMVLFKSTGDVRRGDRFTWNAVPSGRLNYEIVRVEKAFAGMIQAFAEQVQ
jgi:hypothetical protein